MKQFTIDLSNLTLRDFINELSEQTSERTKYGKGKIKVVDTYGTFVTFEISDPPVPKSKIINRMRYDWKVLWNILQSKELDETLGEFFTKRKDKITVNSLNVIKKHFRSIKSCYEELEEEHPDNLNFKFCKIVCLGEEDDRQKEPNLRDKDRRIAKEKIKTIAETTGSSWFMESRFEKKAFNGRLDRVYMYIAYPAPPEIDLFSMRWILLRFYLFSEFVNYSPKSGKRSLKRALNNYGSIGDKVVDNILKILKEEGFIIPLNEK